jgi:hypothetical protein
MADDKSIKLIIEAIFQSKSAEDAIKKYRTSLSKLNKEKEKGNSYDKKELNSIEKLSDYLKKITKERNEATDPSKTKELNKEINKTKESISKLSGEAKSSKSIFSQFTGAAVAGLAAVAGVVSFLESSYMEFAKAQKEGVLLNQAFAQSMGAKEASQATTAFNEFATAMSEVTVYEDDAIIAAGRLMEAITGVSEQGLEKATMAAMDFASATGGDLRGAMEAMSMASEGGRNMFKKYGIEVDDTATKSQKLEQITKGLQDRFGGFAQKEGKTIVGQLKILENQYGNLKEQIGEFLALNVLTSGGEKGILSSIVEGASEGIKLVEGAFVLWGVWITNFGIKLSAQFNAWGDIISGTFQKITMGAKIAATQLKAMVTGADAGKELIDMFKKYDEYIKKVSDGNKTIKAVFTGNDKELKKLGITLVSETDALAEYQGNKEKQLTALHASENKKRIINRKEYTDEQIEAEKKLNEKRVQVLGDWLAMSQSGIEKELNQLKTKYEKDISEAQITGQKKLEIYNLYEKARQSIMENHYKSYVKTIDQEIAAENEKYFDLITNFEGSREQMEEIETQHQLNMASIVATGIATRISMINGELSNLANLYSQNVKSQLENELTQRLNKRKEDYDSELLDLQARKDARLISDGEYISAKEKLDSDYNGGVEAIKKEQKRKEYEAEIKAFRLKKASDIVDATNKGITLGIAMATATAAIPVIGPALVPLAIAGAAGITGAQVALIASQQEPAMPEYAKGTSFLPSDQYAKVHAGERIIPANMNIPGISNAELMQSALSGINMSAMGGGGRQSTYNNYNNTSRTQSFAGAQFNLPGIQNPKDFMRWMQNEANAMGTSIL